MSGNYAFYVHHHGSGHLMRALAIAKRLPKGSVSFLGSNLRSYSGLIPPDIACFQLPPDVPQPTDYAAKLRTIDFLHYAPVNVRGLAERSAMLINVLRAISPVVLVVDVSVEVTLLATLAGFPTVVVRQNGARNDQPHLHAYQCAQLLLAPCSENLMDTSAQNWVEEKTFFSGGFSRYSQWPVMHNGYVQDQIAVLIGSGGTSLDCSSIKQIALQCPTYKVHVIGKPAGAIRVELPKNVILHGLVEDPLPILRMCEIVIGNAGHNTVMEMADLNKRFICITEPRPFDEQINKGKLLAKNRMAVVIDNSEIVNSDWYALIEEVKSLPTDRWKGVIQQDALGRIAARLAGVWIDNFG
ncbi:MAG TPA: glycosyltransferase [Dyadobacter sp.]|jgi:UDP-N-acetylglucosamine:LPS N-acetylglucosamine transferase|nr:glycosyltransferase [Dyadobacter sp.]